MFFFLRYVAENDNVYRVIVSVCRAVSSQLVPYLCAAGMYLFAEHFVMAGIHEILLDLLVHLRRFDEAAYHAHEALRMWSKIFER